MLAYRSSYSGLFETKWRKEYPLLISLLSTHSFLSSLFWYIVSLNLPLLFLCLLFLHFFQCFTPLPAIPSPAFISPILCFTSSPISSSFCSFCWWCCPSFFVLHFLFNPKLCSPRVIQISTLQVIRGILLTSFHRASTDPWRFSSEHDLILTLFTLNV